MLLLIFVSVYHMFEKKARNQTDSHKFHTTMNFGDLFFVQILPLIKNSPQNLRGAPLYGFTFSWLRLAY